MCQQRGVRLEYLPAYSPDLSPIEKSFSCLKAWMRRNREIVSRFPGMFEMFIIVGIEKSEISDHTREWFRSCGIHVDIDDRNERII